MFGWSRAVGKPSGIWWDLLLDEVLRCRSGHWFDWRCECQLDFWSSLETGLSFVKVWIYCLDVTGEYPALMGLVYFRVPCSVLHCRGSCHDFFFALCYICAAAHTMSIVSVFAMFYTTAFSFSAAHTTLATGAPFASSTIASPVCTYFVAACTMKTAFTLCSFTSALFTVYAAVADMASVASYSAESSLSACSFATFAHAMFGKRWLQR